MLFGDLEFAGIKNFSIMVSQLININAPAILVEIDGSFCSNVFLFEYHLSNKIKDLHVVALIGIFLKIECDKRNSRVWIEFDNVLTTILRDS